MRTIELAEWQTKSCRLTAAERDELLKTKLVKLSPAEGGFFDLSAESLVGTFVGTSIRVLVRPKVALENVFFLLGHALGLASWKPKEIFTYVDDPDLLHAMGAFLEAELARAEQRGLVRDYVDREEALSTVRGRIDLAAQIRRRQGRGLPLECRYQEYEVDNELNRLIKAGIARVLSVRGLDHGLRRRLSMRARSFVDVSDVALGLRNLPSISFTRLNRDWEPSARLAELILGRASLVDKTGTRDAMSFTMDMNRVFEAYVERILGEEARKRGWQLLQQHGRRLSADVWMRPDLVLRRRGRELGVADAKYKRVEDKRWPNADVYQLLAYCVGMDLPAGTLIYAESPGLSTQVIERRRVARTELTMQGIDLSGPTRQVLERTRAVANSVIDQAVRAYTTEAHSGVGFTTEISGIGSMHA